MILMSFTFTYRPNNSFYIRDGFSYYLPRYLNILNAILYGTNIVFTDKIVIIVLETLIALYKYEF